MRKIISDRTEALTNLRNLGSFSDYLSLMLGKPCIRLNNLETCLRFPCLGLNPIVDYIILTQQTNRSYDEVEFETRKSQIVFRLFIIRGLGFPCQGRNTTIDYFSHPFYFINGKFTEFLTFHEDSR